MKYLIVLALIFLSCSAPDSKSRNIFTDPKRKTDLSDPSNKLSGKIENLELRYISWGCACANWIKSSDLNEYKTPEKLKEHCIFIEPENRDLEVPFYFDPMRHQILLKGQFYIKPDYPKGTPESEEHLDKAKVFRYSDIKIIDIPREYSKKEEKTLVLNYTPMACECAKWSEFNNTGKKKEHYYLERKEDGLLNVDTLFKGDNLPVQIKVKGYFVSEYGYPKNYSPKGDPKPARVFQYHSVAVLKNNN